MDIPKDIPMPEPWNDPMKNLKKLASNGFISVESYVLPRKVQYPELYQDIDEKVDEMHEQETNRILEEKAREQDQDNANWYYDMERRGDLEEQAMDNFYDK